MRKSNKLIKLALDLKLGLASRHSICAESRNRGSRVWVIGGHFQGSKGERRDFLASHGDQVSW